MFDACVIGHVVCDRNVIAGQARPPCPGGAAYYSSMVYQSLGLRCLAITKVAPEDEDLLLGDLRRAGVEIINLPTACSTVFHNIDAPDGGGREQRVDAVADPIRAEELPELGARIWQLGPLTSRDLDPAIALRCARAGGLVGIDVQGLTREVEDGAVRARGPQRLPDDVALLDVLKADEDEILTFAGARDPAAAAAALREAGVGEVLVTRAGRGSIIFGPGGALEVGAVRPRHNVDPTGCGDTYFAAYLACRLDSSDPLVCGVFAATAAALKMERFGPLQSGRAAILARLEETRPTLARQ